MEMQGNGVKCQKVQISISQRDVKESKEHVSKQGFRCFRCFGVLQVVQLHERLPGAFRCHPQLTHAAERYGSRKGTCLSSRL